MPANDELVRLLGEAYDMEQKLVVALDEMARNAGDPAVSRAFADHRRVTEVQVQRVRDVFAVLGVPAAVGRCAGIDDLIRDHRATMAEAPRTGVERDIGAVRSAAEVERFEIDAYRLLESAAGKCGAPPEAVALLARSRGEESEAAAELDTLARTLSDNVAASEALLPPSR